jgi:VWFA-related protein
MRRSSLQPMLCLRRSSDGLILAPPARPRHGARRTSIRIGSMRIPIRPLASGPLAAVLLLAGAVRLAAAAPQPIETPQTPLPPLAESVTVAVTNVEVVVTDSKGNRVHGLTKNDFEIFEDGIPQPISNFYAVTGGRVLLSDGAEVSLSGEPAPAAKPAEVPDSLKAKYVIFIDNLNIEPLHRNRMFQALFDFLRKTIGPNAEGMVVTHNRSVKVRQGFTSDAEVLIGSLEDVEKESGGMASTVSSRADAIKMINDAPNEDAATTIARQYTMALDNDLRTTVENLKQTISSLAGLPGRKILIYMSDGLPQTVGQEFYELIQRKFHSPSAMTESLEFDRTESYAGIIREANAQGVTIYAIDSAGLQVQEGVSAENETLQDRPSTFLLQRNMQQPLQLLAQETGGIAAINTNNPTRELSEVAQDFSDFYSLGYRSSRGGSDRAHRLEVKIKKKGLRVRYRSGYVDKTIETQTAEAVTAALFYPRTDNPLNIALAVGDPKPYSNDNFLIPVKVSIPLEGVTLVPDGNLYRGRVFLYFVVLDSKGRQSDLQIRPIDIRVDGDKYDSARTKDWAYEVQLIMEPGTQKLSVAARDGVSGTVSFAQKGIFVGAKPAGSASGSP